MKVFRWNQRGPSHTLTLAQNEAFVLIYCWRENRPTQHKLLVDLICLPTAEGAQMKEGRSINQGLQESNPVYLRPGGNEEVQLTGIEDVDVSHTRLTCGFYDFHTSDLSPLSTGRAAPLHLRINPGKSCANSASYLALKGEKLHS